MPHAQTPLPQTRFGFLRSRRFLACVAVLILCGVWLFCGGAANLAVSGARSALARRDVDAAREWFEFADWLHGSEAEVAFLKARASRRQGDIGDARNWLGVALALGTDRRAVQREMILASAQAGRMRDAELWLNELLLHPGDDGQDIFEAFVTGFYVNNEFGKADTLTTSWIADFPDNSYPWIFRAKIKHTNESASSRGKGLSGGIEARSRC